MKKFESSRSWRRAPILGAALSAALALWAGAVPARADLLTPGNLLVSTENFSAPANAVFEYTAGGTQVQRFNVPYPGGRPGTEDVRGIATDQAGRVQIYNGTFAPYLTTLTPTAGGPGAGTFDDHTAAGLSTVANVSFGGIGTLGNFAYLTDMATASPGGPNGIVRFDLTTFATQRFGAGNDYGDLTIGGDGLLYAINNFGGSVPASQIDVYSPTTLGLLRTIALSPNLVTADLRGIAVDASGLLYGAGWDGRIYQASGTGSILNSRPTGTSNLTDIALDNAGRLIVGGRFGDVILTTTSLASQTSFTVGSNPVHVGFVSPLAAVPEPTSLVLTGLGLGGLLGVVARRRRRQP